MSSLNDEQVSQSLHFDVGNFVRKVKNDRDLFPNGMGKVRLNFQGTNPQSSAYHQGDTCVVNLASRQVIEQKMNLDGEEAVAKQKAALCEEIAHCYFHETSHNDDIVSTTVSCIRKNLSPQEQSIPYIQEKIRRLERSPERIVGTERVSGVAQEVL